MAQANDDAALVFRIRDGDAAAEAELILKFRPGLTVMLRRETREITLAEDLAQQCLTTVLEKIRAGEPREPDKLRAFIHGLARNLALAHYRREKRRGPHSDVAEQPLAADESHDARAQILRQERIETVRRLLAEMDDGREKALLLRFYLAEESKESLCREFSVSSLHFNRVLYKARQTFKQMWERLHDRG